MVPRLTTVGTYDQLFQQICVSIYDQCVDLQPNNLNKIENWSNIIELIPDFYLKNNMKKTGIAGIFSACLELTKEGIVKVSQERLFEKLLIKKS